MVPHKILPAILAALSPDPVCRQGTTYSASLAGLPFLLDADLQAALASGGDSFQGRTLDYLESGEFRGS
jgi:hypothetical protein